jgi:hypothetical protein
MTTQYRCHYDLMPHLDREGMVLIRVASKPGSSNHREEFIGLAKRGSPRLMEFCRRVDAMRSDKPTTVRQRADLMRLMWRELYDLPNN